MLFSSVVNAKIYKWVDANGVTHYSEEKPANIQTQEFKIKSYDTVSFDTIDEDDENEEDSYKFKPIKRNLELTRTVRKKVIMYSTQWCGYCKKARKYFKKEGVRYTDYDIDKSKTARARYDKMGAKGVPVILVGKKRMNGFSEAGFNRIYK